MAGQIYTIEETDEGGVFYTLKDMSESDASNPLGLAETTSGSKVYEFIAPSSDSAKGSNKIVVTNTHDTSAKIEITKAMLGTQVALDSVNDKMTFILSGGNIPTGSEKEFELAIGGTATFSDLTPGQTYTLTETLIDGYKLNNVTVEAGSTTGSSVAKTSSTQYTVTILNTKNSEVILKVTNEYDMIPTSSLNVHKVLTNN